MNFQSDPQRETQRVVSINNFPFHLVLIINGTVAFEVFRHFKLIQDNLQGGKVRGVYDMEGFSLDGEPFMYNTQYSYKEIPVLLKWLQEQALDMRTLESHL